MSVRSIGHYYECDVLFAHAIASIVDELRIAMPIKSGITVPLNICPIIVPNKIAINNPMDPITLAAIPAICPRGSIAKAFKFPNNIPKQKNIDAR